jgi:hypothetical protein
MWPLCLLCMKWSLTPALHTVIVKINTIRKWDSTANLFLKSIHFQLHSPSPIEMCFIRSGSKLSCNTMTCKLLYERTSDFLLLTNWCNPYSLCIMQRIINPSSISLVSHSFKILATLWIQKFWSQYQLKWRMFIRSFSQVFCNVKNFNNYSKMTVFYALFSKALCSYRVISIYKIGLVCIFSINIPNRTSDKAIGYTLCFQIVMHLNSLQQWL